MPLPQRYPIGSAPVTGEVHAAPKRSLDKIYEIGKSGRMRVVWVAPLRRAVWECREMIVEHNYIV